MKFNRTVLATFASKSNPSKSHDVRMGANGHIYCTCPGWKFQKLHPLKRTCTHLKQFAALATVTEQVG
jgi:hypothetical protein